MYVLHIIYVSISNLISTFVNACNSFNTNCRFNFNLHSNFENICNVCNAYNACILCSVCYVCYVFYLNSKKNSKSTLLNVCNELVLNFKINFKFVFHFGNVCNVCNVYHIFNLFNVCNVCNIWNIFNVCDVCDVFKVSFQNQIHNSLL